MPSTHAGLAGPQVRNTVDRTQAMRTVACQTQCAASCLARDRFVSFEHSDHDRFARLEFDRLTVVCEGLAHLDWQAT